MSPVVNAPTVRYRVGAWLIVLLLCGLAYVAGVQLAPRQTTEDSVDVQRTQTLPVAQVPDRISRDPMQTAGADGSSNVPTLAADVHRVRHEGVPRYHPRASGEWQGMLVNMTLRAACDASWRCGLAMACKADGRCGPCERDTECADGEVCVLDHCLRRELASCHTTRDCTERGTPCILTGYSVGARGNSEMRSLCQSSSGGRTQVALDPGSSATVRRDSPVVDHQQLLRSLRDASVEE